ncbi:hypothetical protein PCC7424_4427 [Gloeothece citriformis PCC 7424]|uniref:Uncharacterized protein n=1 Tax=Gloeothece citriformis (strain PCC 7424) TaxID=65393 RepID=B7K922_GLOC7|nr:hypothetical protein [Gloeothece citriformis]ACK72791.1 hypothetical protein PCC7424_4427 [Gloeothece citriformis PCC 7424]
MLYWGYIAGRSNTSIFQVDELEEATEKLVSYCETNASQPVFAAIEATKQCYLKLSAEEKQKAVSVIG